MAAIGYESASARLARSSVGDGWRTARHRLSESRLYSWLAADVSAVSTIGSYSYHARAWLFALLAIAATGLVAATRLVSPWIGVVALTIGVSLFGCRQYWRGNVLLTLLATAYLFRLGIIVLDSQVGILVQPDISIGHHGRAMSLADAWLNGRIGGILGDVTLMRRFIAYTHAPFYFLLGRWQLAGELGTAFYGTAIGYAMYAIARQVTTRRNAVLAAGAVVFWPSIVYRSVVIQREVLAVLSMLTAVWIALRLTQPNRLYERFPDERVWKTAHWTKRLPAADLSLLLVAIGVVYVTRKENIAVVGITLVVALALRNREMPWRFVAIGALLLPVFSYFALNFADFVDGSTALTPAGLDTYAHYRDHGGSAYLTTLHYRTWLDVVLYAPVKIVYFLFSPLPWQVDSLTDFLAGVSGWGLFIAVLLSGRGFVLLRAHPEKRATLAAYAISGITAYAIIEMNSGAAFRRRIQFVPIVLLLAVIALTSVSFRQRSGQPTRESIVSSEKENTTTMRRD
jgi:hypothetical protein